MSDLGQKLLLAFEGLHDLPDELRIAIRAYRPSGLTLFRAFNVQNPAQVRELTNRLQAEAQREDLPPFIIACDQEGGQLLAINEGVTQLPGNLALGATGSAELAFQAGQVLGRELAAMGVNVDYAPCCDVNINPLNPVIGTRSFGENPEQVAALAVAMTQGIQSCGVAAGAKHFPGHGDTAGDSHYAIPQSPHGLERLRAVEFSPFASAIQAGVRLVMTAHLALPAVDGRDDLPATLSPLILQGLLRDGLGFDGVIVTDAMDMHAIQQGEALTGQAAQAALAGADLLLVTRDPADWRRAFDGLRQAFPAGNEVALQTSLRRVAALKTWLASAPPAPDLSIVGCPAHRAIADDIAAHSINLVRDTAQMLPLRPSETPRLAVILFQPQDLTPADTSSYVKIGLAAALRQYLPQVDEYLLPYAPAVGDISAVLVEIPVHVPVLIGTINAYAEPGQAALVNAALAAGRQVIVAALRMPYDLMAFPSAPTYLCTYGILEPSMRALARVLVGEAAAPGCLPVSIPGI